MKNVKLSAALAGISLFLAMPPAAKANTLSSELTALQAKYQEMATSLSQTVTASDEARPRGVIIDKSKMGFTIYADTTASPVLIDLDSAVNLGAGFTVWIVNMGMNPAVILCRQSGFFGNGRNDDAVTLSYRGESVGITATKNAIGDAILVPVISGSRD